MIPSSLSSTSAARKRRHTPKKEPPPLPSQSRLIPPTPSSQQSQRYSNHHLHHYPNDSSEKQQQLQYNDCGPPISRNRGFTRILTNWIRIKRFQSKSRQRSFSFISTVVVRYMVPLLVTTIVLWWIQDQTYAHYCLSFYPYYHTRSFPNNDDTTTTKTTMTPSSPTVPIEQSSIAVVSLHNHHNCWDRRGLLGRFLRDDKRSYALRHGYSLIDSMLSLPSDTNYGGGYPTLRILWHTMETHRNLEWLLWIDGYGAVITRPSVSVTERIEMFRKIHNRRRLRDQMAGGRNNLNHNGDDDNDDDGNRNGDSTPELCLVWSRSRSRNDLNQHDDNTGVVLLIRNNAVTRELFRTASLQQKQSREVEDGTSDSSIRKKKTMDTRLAKDRTVLAAAVESNSTYRDCQLLFEDGNDGGDSVLLQSRITSMTAVVPQLNNDDNKNGSSSSSEWKPGHWILSLPRHHHHHHHHQTYYQTLSIIQYAGKQWHSSPPPLFPPLPRPNLHSLSNTRRDRFRSVQSAIRHAWRGYADLCLHSTNRNKWLGSHIPPDDLRPLSNNDDGNGNNDSGSNGNTQQKQQPQPHGHDWLYHAATLHDSLDTLLLAFGPTSPEYQEALSFLLTNNDLSATALRPTKTFEYSLRVVGGLAGAFALSGDVRLLGRLRDALDSLMEGPFGENSCRTVLPRSFDVLAPPVRNRDGVGYGLGGFGAVGEWIARWLYRTYSRVYRWGRDAFTTEHRTNSLAGVGSFALEFYYVSRVTGDGLYRSKVNDIFQHVLAKQLPSRDGSAHDGGNITSLPVVWDVMTGEPISRQRVLGSGVDSFVEYLLKVPLLECETDLGDCGEAEEDVRDMRDFYDKIVQGFLRSNGGGGSSSRSNENVVWNRNDNSDASVIAYPTDYSSYQQLLCFLPGMVALGASSGLGSKTPVNENDFTLAEAMLRGCHDMYARTVTKLGPEEASVPPSPKTVGLDPSYLLRPEYVESLFYMYRLTGKEEYQEMGWEVFQSLEKYCKTKRGYSGLLNVYNPPRIDQTGKEDDNRRHRVNDMPSYFIAETLKYLLLLFGPDDFLSLEDFVFTTEAHPLRRKRSRIDHYDGSTDMDSVENGGFYKVHLPFPWYLFGVLLAVLVVVVVVVVVLGAVVARHLKNKKLIK